MTYEISSLNPQRIFNYALRVARASSDTPTSYCLVRSVTTTRHMFSSTRNVQWSRVDIGGWILVLDREEGCASRVDSYRRNSTLCQESGRILVLERSGKLLAGRYDLLHVAGNGNELDGTTSEVSQLLALESAADIASFDRVNTADYTMRRTTTENETWRRELDRNFRIRVPHAGMATSLALKNLLERGAYIRSITPGF